MAYPVNIVINDRNWYDSRIALDDPVVYQNVNYVTGNVRSVNVVRQRFIQDWARQIIPNSIRQGVGLTATPSSDQIVVTQGYAIVAGRFIDVPSGTWDASIEGLVSGKNYYLTIQVAAFTESDTRKSTDGTAALIAKELPYVKSHNELVIGKFYYDGTTISAFEDYTAQQEWQTSVISPVSVYPGLTTGSDNILIRAGAEERINNFGIETDKTRFYLNAVFNDQTASTEVKLINNNGILETRDITDTSYLGHDILNLLIGGTERIDSSGNLINIGTINLRTMGGNASTDLIDTDSTQTMSNKTLTTPVIATFYQDAGLLNLWTLQATTDTFVGKATTDTLTNKTLTSPIITGGTLNAGTALTVTSTELNQIGAGYVRGGTSTGDIVDLDSAQLLENKKLKGGVVIEESGIGTNYGTITIPTLSADPIYDINKATSDTFLMEGSVNTITGAKTFAADNIFIMTGSVWSSATHTHQANNQGSILDINNASTGTLATSRGGTGLTSFNDRGIVYAISTSSLSTLASAINYSYLFSSAVGDPTWKSPSITLSGSVNRLAVTPDSSGDWVVNNITVSDDTHLHNLSYIPYNTEMQTPMSFIGSQNDANLDFYVENYEYTMGGVGDTKVMWVAPIPRPISGKTLYVTDIKMRISGDLQNYVSSVYIYFINSSSAPTDILKYSSTASRYNPSEYTFAINSLMSSTYEYVFMKFDTIFATYGLLRFSVPVISYHYE